MVKFVGHYLRMVTNVNIKNSSFEFFLNSPATKVLDPIPSKTTGPLYRHDQIWSPQILDRLSNLLIALIIDQDLTAT